MRAKRKSKMWNDVNKLEKERERKRQRFEKMLNVVNNVKQKKKMNEKTDVTRGVLTPI